MRDIGCRMWSVVKAAEYIKLVTPILPTEHSRGNLIEVISHKEVTSQKGTMRNVRSQIAGHASRLVAERKGFSSRTVCWPDPDPVATEAGTYVDDISGVHSTLVAGVRSPRTAEEVIQLICSCSQSGTKVSMRGTQHSMGGHSISPGGLVLDLKEMKSIAFVNSNSFVATVDGDDVSNRFVEVGPGVTWAELIVFLNPYGLSPRTMQSYSSFSIGGTLAVNGHGVTTDYTVAESVVGFDLVIHDGTVVQCGRNAATEAGKELFGLVLGGYGLFGVMIKITLLVSKNVPIVAETFPVASSELPFVYQGLLGGFGARDIAVKLVRLDVTNPDNLMVYLFRTRTDAHPIEDEGVEEKRFVPTCVGNLSPVVREMSPFKRLLYKWLMTPLMEFRFKVEAQRGSAIDWVDSHDKNSLMFETAAPLARISDPLFTMDDTFILQEFFVPMKKYAAFMAEVKPIYAEAMTMGSDHDAKEKDGSKTSSGASCRLHLLNTTIRFVRRDTDTFLQYARCPEGMFAFVLYYRIHRTEASLERLRHFHHRFAEAALACGGSFFLPYLHHYTLDQLERAYPSIRDFFAKKEKYDPTGLFDSKWFREYGLTLVSPTYRQRFTIAPASPQPNATLMVDTKCDGILAAHGGGDDQAKSNKNILCVSERREDSFKRLMASYSLRSKFQHVFLEHVFNVAPSNAALCATMSRIFWDSRIASDLDAFEAMQRWFAAEVLSNTLASAQLEVNKVLQIARQKTELANETLRLVSHLGRVGKMDGYVSIGDNGKLVLPLRRALKLTGKSYIVHNEDPEPHSVPAAVERGSSLPVGTYCRINYELGLMPDVPDGSVDLVTMNQGLHHLPQESLLVFIMEVRRVLRPGGLFITREHDGVPSLIPMLDMAHSIFNLLVGVDFASERNEIRAFRPIEEWRNILRDCGGFQDTCCYELQQQTDPTLDYMICFMKPGTHQERKGGGEVNTLSSDGAPPFQAALDDVPNQVLRGGKAFLQLVSNLCDSIGGVVTELAPSGQEQVVGVAVQQALTPIRTVIRRLEILSDEVNPHASLQLDVFPTEFFHGYVALDRRVSLGKATAGEVLLVQALKSAFRTLFDGGDQASGNTQPNPAPQSPAHPEGIRQTKAEIRRTEAAILVQAVLEKQPQLLLVETYANGGFPPAVVDIVRSSFVEPHSRSSSTTNTSSDCGMADRRLRTKQLSEKLADMIASRCDDTSWSMLRAVIKDEILCDQRNNSNPHPQLSMASLLGREPLKDNCWNHVFLAVLASTRVELTFVTRMAARMYGIFELDDLKEMALARRDEHNRKQRRTVGGPNVSEDTTISLSQSDSQELQGLSQHLDCSIFTITLRGAKNMRNIPRVSEVISAIFQENKDVSAVVRHSLLQGNTIVLEDVDLDRVFSFGLTPLSRFFYGDRTLTITYRTTDPPLISAAVDASRSLTAKLQAVGALQVPATSQNASVYNVFRLAEWLQVDMCKSFANSLDHTPWYRFEFLKSMRVYYQVLLRCSQHVQASHGVRAAYLSSPFMTSFVPSLAMGLVFAQLQLLSLPVKMRLGDRYKETQLQQQALVRVRRIETNTTSDDDDDDADGDDDVDGIRSSPSRSCDAEDLIFPEIFRTRAADEHGLVLPAPRRLVGEFYEVSLPVFGKFRDYLVAFARYDAPSSRSARRKQQLPIFESTIVSIDGEVTLRLLVGVQDTAQLELLRRSQLCQVAFDFQLPTDEGPSGCGGMQRVSLSAAVVHLLKLLQLCDESKIQVLHIFDVRV